MAELERMIEEVRAWREFHRARGGRIEAAACAIRERALVEARDAVLAETKSRG